jgi:hypothetical protein
MALPAWKDESTDRPQLSISLDFVLSEIPPYNANLLGEAEEQPEDVSTMPNAYIQVRI